jgi:sensor histidine kinase YesM
VYISLFYISYSFLIPIFLFRKKILPFVAGSIIIITASYFINQTIARNQFITVFKQMEGTSIQNSFGHDPFNHVDPGSMKKPPAEFDREMLRRPEFEKMLRNRRQPFGGPGFDRKLFPLYGLLLVYFASISSKFLLKFREDEEKKEGIMKERISTELLYLKQQINPHFLFNTLNNIYALSIKNPEITPDAILKVSSILRYTLYKSDNLLALLKDEIEIIDAYIDFQKMRSKNILPITYSISGSTDDKKIEPFILLPLIENAFKYGMANLNDSFIIIRITINSDKLEFFISNKKSFLNESDSEYSGIGLKNIKRRLDLVYPDCHELKIIDEDDVFSVYLNLPLRKE